jgi:hypothetical protein
MVIMMVIVNMSKVATYRCFLRHLVFHSATKNDLSLLFERCAGSTKPIAVRDLAVSE